MIPVTVVIRPEDAARLVCAEHPDPVAAATQFVSSVVQEALEHKFNPAEKTAPKKRKKS